MSRFDDCLKFVLAREGGKVDDPTDRGGRTAYGITQRVFDLYRAQQGLEAKDVWEITPDETAQIYGKDFWNAYRCGKFRPPVDLVVFDAFVQHRPRVVAQMVQRAVGAEVDGLIGPKTIERANSLEPSLLAERIIQLRLQLYQNIISHDPTQGRFMKGWLNRLHALEKESGLI